MYLRLGGDRCPRREIMCGNKGEKLPKRDKQHEARREANSPHLANLVLNNKRHILGHRECDRVGQRGGLGEHVEVTESKRQRARLLEFNDDLILVILVGATSLLEVDVTVTELTGCAELDAFLRHVDVDRLADRAQVLRVCGVYQIANVSAWPSVFDHLTSQDA